MGKICSQSREWLKASTNRALLQSERMPGRDHPLAHISRRLRSERIIFDNSVYIKFTNSSHLCLHLNR